jgi:hypothetical protein
MYKVDKARVNQSPCGEWYFQFLFSRCDWPHIPPPRRQETEIDVSTACYYQRQRSCRDKLWSCRLRKNMQQSRTLVLTPSNILQPFFKHLLCCGGSHCRWRIFSKQCSIFIELNAALFRLFCSLDQFSRSSYVDDNSCLLVRSLPSSFNTMTSHRGIYIYEC